MIQIETVQPGDTLVWMGKCGEISGKVKRVANGMLAAFTDEVHSFPIELLCCSNGARLNEGLHHRQDKKIEELRAEISWLRAEFRAATGNDINDIL